MAPGWHHCPGLPGHLGATYSLDYGETAQGLLLGHLGVRREEPRNTVSVVSPEGKGTGERRWGVGAVDLHTTWSHSSFSVLWPEPFGGDSDTFLGTAWPSERDTWWPRGIMRGQHLGREVPREYPAPWQWHSSVLKPDLGPPRSRYPGKTRAPGMGAKDYGWRSRLGKDGFRVLGHNPDGVRSR